MNIKFIKMHGLGNDFVLIDNREQNYVISEDNVKFLGDRHRGIGFDQLLLLEKSDKCDVFMRVYNSDASQAGGCGNGARCVAKYFYDKEGETELSMETTTTVWKTSFLGNGVYQVNMGMAKTDWKDIPLAKEADTLNLDLGLSACATCVNVGNPHAVFFVEDINKIDLAKDGRYVETHPIFPQKTNVEFAQIIDDKTIRMRVWERGEGITQACGTGASATLVAAVRQGLIKEEADIILDGGVLNVKWKDEVLMSGPATKVFEAEIELNN